VKTTIKRIMRMRHLHERMAGAKGVRERGDRRACSPTLLRMWLYRFTREDGGRERRERKAGKKMAGDNGGRECREKKWRESMAGKKMAG
jgi:hypothetical protein